MTSSPSLERGLVELRSIFRQHKLPKPARDAIIAWATSLDREAQSYGVQAVFAAQQKRHDEWLARRERLEALGIYPVVRVLRAGLNAVNGGPRGTMWNTAKEDELARAADRIVTGDDEAEREKFIAACRAFPY